MKKIVVMFLAALCFVFLFCNLNSGATVCNELKIIVYPGKGITVENLDKEKFDLNLSEKYGKVYLLGDPDSIYWPPTENGFMSYMLYASYGLGFLIDDRNYNIYMIDIWSTYAQTAEGVKIGDRFDVAEKIYNGKFQPLYDVPAQEALNNQYIMICKEKGIRFYGIKRGSESNITCINIFSMEAEK